MSEAEAEAETGGTTTLSTVTSCLTTPSKIGQIVISFNSSVVFVLLVAITLNREPLLRGRISTLDLLVLTCLDQLLLIMKILFFSFYKTNYLNEEVNCTYLPPSVRVPWAECGGGKPGSQPNEVNLISFCQ